MNNKSEIRKRFIRSIPHFLSLLFIVLIFHFFGGKDGSPWSWQEILINLPMLIIVYLIVIFIRG
jgi:hypothetical protein